MEVSAMKSDLQVSWKRVKLSEVSEIIAGQSPESKYYNNIGQGIPFFQGKADFGDDYPSVRYWCTQPTKVAKPNDILISVRAPVGPTNICDIEACIGRGLAAIRSSNVLYFKYLYFYFKTIQDKLASQGNGSTFSAITTAVLKDLEIPLPPLSTQKRIAEILDAADALRRKDQELLKKYDELAQAIFIDMFGDPVKNEKGWEVKELHHVCKHIFGGGTPSKSKPEYYLGNIPWVTPKDMKSDIISDAIDHINEEAVINSSTKLVPENSVLMVIRSGILKHTLPVAINDKIVAMNQDMKAFVPNTDLTNAIFLKYFFHRVASFLLSKVRAVTADNIEFEQIKNMQFICPPIKLQNDFSICISNIQKQFETNLDHNKKTASLFDSLIQKAFKGELV